MTTVAIHSQIARSTVAEAPERQSFHARLREAITRVKPLTRERMAAARVNTEQEFCGGFDREPVDEP